MYLIAFAQIESLYHMSYGVLTNIHADQLVKFMQLKVDLIRPANMKFIPPLFNHDVMPREVGLFKVESSVMAAYRSWDLRYFAEHAGIYPDLDFYIGNVWKESKISCVAGMPWDCMTSVHPVGPGYDKETSKPGEILSLTAICLRQLSFYNRAFTGCRWGQYTYRSLEELYPNKMVNGMSKIGRPTRGPNDFALSLGHLLAPALRRLNSMAGWDKNIGSVKYEPDRDRSSTMPVGSSSGARSGKGSVEPPDDDRPYYRVYSYTGKKLEHRSYALDSFKEMLSAARRGILLPFHDCAWVYSVKSEVFSAYEKANEIDFRKAKDKFRLFKIDFATGYLLESHVFSTRQKMERGRVIRIGMKWWHGGAQDLAEILRYKDPDMKWDDGDVSGFDLSLNKFLIEIYCSQAGIYYNFEDGDEEVYKLLLRQAMRHLSIRISHLYGNEWRILFGGMPSGAYSTSHGDSWILAFLYCLFVEWVKFTNPSLRNRIDVEFLNGRIIIVVYGDDHIIGVATGLHEFLGELAFEKFLAKFWDMEMKDIRSDVPFMSVPSPQGGLTSTGLVFLQRYFVDRPAWFPDTPDYPDIYPYRPVHKYIHKLPFSSGDKRTAVDVLLACCGSAYDTMGTNDVAYEFLKHIYCTVASIEKIYDQDVSELFRERLTDLDEKDLIKLLRKGEIDTDSLCKGFPTMDTLVKMHTMDREYHKIVDYDREYQ